MHLNVVHILILLWPSKDNIVVVHSISILSCNIKSGDMERMLFIGANIIAKGMGIPSQGVLHAQYVLLHPRYIRYIARMRFIIYLKQW